MRPLVLGCLVAALASCGNGLDAAAGGVDISVSYEDTSEPGFMEQTVLLEHRSDRSVVPTMSYTPLDADGAVVPGVEVSSIFGSDSGRLIVGPAGEIDVLMFEGDRASEVVNALGVALEVVELDVATELLLSQPQAISNGTEVSKFDAFDEVSLSNETSQDATVRVVCILWNSPEPGHA